MLLASNRTQQRPTQGPYPRPKQHIPQDPSRAGTEEAIRRLAAPSLLAVVLAVVVAMMVLSSRRRSATVEALRRVGL